MACRLGISGSILNANPCFLGQAIQNLQAAKIDSLHFDLMDGNFVHEISWGTSVLSPSRDLTALPFDVHLMVCNPEKYVEACAKAQVYQVAFHPQACQAPFDMIQRIQDLGMKAAVAISPHEDPLQWPFWAKADAGLVMTVVPGKGGQTFLPQPLRWIQPLKDAHPHLVFGVDGGINLETALEAKKAGADYLVCGSFLMRNPCMADAVQQLKKRLVWPNS